MSPKRISQTRRADEMVWLRSRLIELMSDINRYEQKADELALGGVQHHLRLSHVNTRNALTVLDHITTEQAAIT